MEATERLWRSRRLLFDFLDPRSPLYALKQLEAERYWEVFGPGTEGLGPGARVLDAGGGIGRFSVTLLRRGIDVVLLDASRAALRRALVHMSRARRGGARFDLVWADLDELAGSRSRGSPTRFDLVLAVELLSYVHRPQAVLGWLTRRLRPGGRLLLSVENPLGALLSDPDVTPERWREIRRHGWTLLRENRFTRYFSREQLESLIAEAGLNLLHLEGTHYAFEGPFDRLAIQKRLQTRRGRAQLLDWDRQFARDSTVAPLARAWAAVAQKPR